MIETVTTSSAISTIQTACKITPKLSKMVQKKKKRRMIRTNLTTITTSKKKKWSNNLSNFNLPLNWAKIKLWKVQCLLTSKWCCKLRLLNKCSKISLIIMFRINCHIRNNPFKFCQISKTTRFLLAKENWMMQNRISSYLNLRLAKMMLLLCLGCNARTRTVRTEMQNSKWPLKTQRVSRPMTFLNKRWCKIKCLNGLQENLPLPKDRRDKILQLPKE